ncbi:MAG TPA: anthranilate phosphoribosyltransferase [Acidimicrobiales bacterium]|nr:anthranilate phosphoribosyltransferase [Acidimicrobiales bacterium]
MAEVLVRITEGLDLSEGDAHDVMAQILAGEATPAQIAGFLIAERSKGPTTEELCGMLRAMLGASEPVHLSSDALDTCGTGGSRQRREAAFNVSTVAALVVAGAGAKVCKHGNRKASATSGSADLLEALGVTIDVGPAGVAQCVEEAGIGFCLAPRFHPGMRHPGPVRRELGVATVFNLLGPMANPARVKRQVIGVVDGGVAEKVVRVLQANGAERAMVVYGHDGLDELSTAAPSTVVELRNGEVHSFDVDAGSLGLTSVQTAPAGGDTAANVELARRVLDGEPGAHRDIVLLNAAAGLVVAGVADDLPSALEAAVAAVDDGRAAAALERLVTVSKRAADV